MTRLSLLATLALLLSACAATPPQPSASDAADARPPNIILIVADDLGYGDIGVNGASLIRTPNIDALAARGVNFTSGYVTAAVCAPSRMAIMTGRHQQRLGYEFNPRRRQDLGIPEGTATIPALLRDRGYRTALIGKWHLGRTPELHPLNRGFDEFFGNTGGSNGSLVTPGPGDEWMSDQVQGTRQGFIPMSLFRGTEPVEVTGGYLPDILTDEAASFIERNRSQPFFLVLTHNAPHSPLQASAQYLEPYRGVPDQATRIYAAMVAALDASVGRIVETLRRNGLEENTLIVFMSDNGCAAYIGAGACSNGPLQGFKGTYFEGGVRVPMVAYWPNHIEGGRVFEHPVSSMDWSATFLGIGGSDATATPLDGRNLLPFIENPALGAPRSMLVWRTQPNFSIRDGDWKLLSIERSDGAGMVTLLFNLRTDPGETRDVSAEHPEIVARLTGLFQEWQRDVPNPAFESQRTGSFPLPNGVEVNVYN
jgi:arylsulfatase A-like enzyme